MRSAINLNNKTGTVIADEIAMANEVVAAAVRKALVAAAARKGHAAAKVSGIGRPRLQIKDKVGCLAAQAPADATSKTTAAVAALVSLAAAGAMKARPRKGPAADVAAAVWAAPARR